MHKILLILVVLFLVACNSDSDYSKCMDKCEKKWQKHFVESDMPFDELPDTAGWIVKQCALVECKDE